MNIKSLCLVSMTIVITSYGQKNTLIVSDNIALPRDTIVKEQLLTSLNGFLFQITKPNKENSFVLNSDLLETSVLLDEMKDLGNNNKLKEDNFYKAYLTNATQLNDTNFLIQLSYIGVNEGSPILRASFTLIAKKGGTQFYFYSPLKQNTTSWNEKRPPGWRLSQWATPVHASLAGETPAEPPPARRRR